MRQKISIPQATCVRCFVYDSASMYRMDWTDGRLQERFDSIDQRFDGVDQRFDQVDRRIDQVGQRIDDLDRRVDKRFDKVDSELQRVNDRLDGLHRVLMQIGAGIFVALLGLIATQL